MRRALQIFIGAPSKHSHRHEREPDQPTSLTKVVTPQWPPRAQRHKERTRPLSGPRSRRQPIATAETPSLFELWSLGNFARRPPFIGRVADCSSPGRPDGRRSDCSASEPFRPPPSRWRGHRLPV